MKIYILIKNVCVDFEASVTAKAFRTREEAQKELDEFAHDEYQTSKEADWLIESETDTGETDGSYTNGWASYLEGYENENHSYAWIKEQDL